MARRSFGAGGISWSDPTMIFLSGDNATRPYVKYASDNAGRIDLFYTDGYPRNEPENNVYHVYYEDGAFYNSSVESIMISSFRSLKALRIAF